MRIVLAGIALGTLIWGHPAKGDFIFGEPTLVPNVNREGATAAVPHITRDGLELYFVSNYPDETGDASDNIWVSRRPTTKLPWSAPIKLPAPVNTAGSENFPCVSSDGLELYFSKGFADIWVTTRASKNDPWGEPTLVPAPIYGSGTLDYSLCLSADGLEMYFASDRPGGGTNPTNTDIFVATRASRDYAWGDPVKLGSTVNGQQYENMPFVSANGLALFFSRGYSKGHVYVCRRPTTADPWGPAEFFAPVNSGSAGDVWGDSPGQAEYGLCFSEADSILYFQRGVSAYSADYKIYQVKVTPTVDTDNDGVVTTMDILAVMGHFGPNQDSLYDVAPLPFGDGIVDVRDLEVFLENWGKDLRVVAHWPLDETEGIIAHDSVGDNDATTVMGAPVWCPADGVFDGALELDGTTYLRADSVLNPAEGAFSVFAWIKGGAPGQVMISQMTGDNWLMADAATGALATGLTAGGPGTQIVSETVITDGYWHHVGFTWDGSARRLYVDDVLVAEDTQHGLAGATGKLFIGCGIFMDIFGLDTFFSGLIDDIRVYRRAVTR